MNELPGVGIDPIASLLLEIGFEKFFFRHHKDKGVVVCSIQRCLVAVRSSRRFQCDLVVWAEPLGESAQRFRSSADASHTVYPSTWKGLGDLSEILVDIQSN